MTRRQISVIRLARAAQAIHIETGLFLAPDAIRSSGVFVVADRLAHTVKVRLADSVQEFVITGSGRIVNEKFGGSDAYWYAIDTNKITKDSPLYGYAGFCFVGEARAEIVLEEGFIPFGETEIMLDANGDKFLIIGSE